MFELRQPSSRRRQRTCRRRRWRHEGGEALVADQVVVRETKLLQRGPPPQGWREGHQPRVADGDVAQMQGLEPRQGASAQGGGERREAPVLPTCMVLRSRKVTAGSDPAPSFSTSRCTPSAGPADHPVQRVNSSAVALKGW